MFHVKQFLAVPLAFVLTLLEMISDPVSFFDPTTEEAPSGHTSSGKSRSDVPGQSNDLQRGS